MLSGAADALKQILVQRLGDSYFTSKRRNESAKAAVFTRKIGHTQRGGRPILFLVAEDWSAESVLPPRSVLVSSPNAASELWRPRPVDEAIRT